MTTDSRTQSINPNRPYLTSAPLIHPWGQPAASYFFFVGPKAYSIEGPYLSSHMVPESGLGVLSTVSSSDVEDDTNEMVGLVALFDKAVSEPDDFIPFDQAMDDLDKNQ